MGCSNDNSLVNGNGAGGSKRGSKGEWKGSRNVYSSGSSSNYITYC